MKVTKRRDFLILSTGFAGSAFAKSTRANNQDPSFVSLRDAHKGTVEIDLRIMNQFGEQPQEVQNFYLAYREAVMSEKAEEKVTEVCRQFGRPILGGPMLGDLTSTSVSVWMHLAEPVALKVVVQEKNGKDLKNFNFEKGERILSLPCLGLTPDTSYTYQVMDERERVLGEGSFTTAPVELSEKPFRISFGADFHKVGMYRPELLEQVGKRGSRAMLLIGDSAVDGRKDDYALISSDYLLRDLSPPIQNLVRNTPTSATWDDHDYWGNDTSGTRTNGKKPIDVDGLRRTWKTHWNNPERDVKREGIYFESHLGPIHYLALDTRSCRVNKEQGKLNSFLGSEQMAWLKKRIKESTSPFIIISGGTMWSDYISNGKDSWGVWDKEGREEIFKIIDEKKDSEVLLLSGDRHGARAFAIPRSNGKPIHEFEVGTLGGCPGPDSHGNDRSAQLFGYPGLTWAIGEFTFDLEERVPRVTFKLHNEKGKLLETVILGGKKGE